MIRLSGFAVNSGASISIGSLIISFCPVTVQRYVAQIQSTLLGQRFVRSVSWSLAGGLISRALALISSIVLARILGKEGFGELGIIQSTVGMFQVFGGLGLGLTATKHIGEFRLKDPVRAGRVISLSESVTIGTGASVALLLFILAPWLAVNTLAAPHLTNVLRIGSLIIFFGSLNGVQTGIMVGFEAFQGIARISFISGIMALPLMIGGVFWKGLEGAVWGLSGSMGVNCILNHLAIRAEAQGSAIPITWRGCLQERGVLFSFSLPVLLTGVMAVPVTWACNAMLVNQPNGYREMAIFNAANQGFVGLLFLPAVLSQPILPILAELWGRDEHKRCRKILGQSLKLNALVTIPLFLIGCLISPVIMSLYGNNYSDSWPVLVVALFTAGLHAMLTPVHQMLVAADRMWIGLLINTGWSVVFLGVTVAFVRWGALGLSCSRAIAYILSAVLTFAFAYFFILKSARRV